MERIRVAWGSGRGPTATASFDAALADANLANYNLVTVSSVVPADATVERVGTAPDLGPAGDALYCVLARTTLDPGADGPAAAGIGWARSPSGEGLFYEESGTGADAVRERVVGGLDHGLALRDWNAERDPAVIVETRSAVEDAHTTAVVVAAYGRSQSLL
ncbi:MAG: pyruvoyl-dependent arginine decarboxylase [Haloarculaceae archaeon]